jgi:geranylgeranyl pyrophosphate synthase
VGEIRQAQGRYAFDASQRQYEEIAGAKTGVLYGAAAELGVRFARPEAEALGAQMRALGEELGLAFQIADDLLDLEGEESVVGKSVGTDVDDGKVTLPVLFAWQAADVETRAAIESAYRAPGVPDRRAALFEACNLPRGCALARARADELVASARARLEQLPDTASREALERVLEFTLERRS